MKRRYVIFGLSVVFALTLAVPAFGGPMDPVATVASSAKSIAQKALKKANKAQSTANTALTDAKNAQTSANNAQTSANKAQTTANTALTDAQNAQTSANTAETDAQNANTNANSRIKGATEAVSAVSANNATTGKSETASCPSGDPSLGGGYVIGGTNVNETVVTTEEYPLYATGWFVEAEAINGMSPTWDLEAIAVCGTH